MDKGYVQVYTGNGKGKTTAAIGLAIRAAGRGLRVLIIQFLKGSDSGELDVLKCVEGITLTRPTETAKFFWNMNEEEKRRMKELSSYAFCDIQKMFGKGEIDLLILDEALGALKNGTITKDEVEQILDKRPDTTEIVLTGRDAPDWLIDMADLVTEMVPVKHYINEGVKARKGIEY